MTVDRTKTHDSNGDAEYSNEAMSELIRSIDGKFEEGSNYIKFENGTMIQWGLEMRTNGINSPIGSLFQETSPTLTAFPINFTASPKIFATLERTDRIGGVSIKWLGSGGFNNQVWSATSFAPNYDYYIHWVAIGRWK